MKYSFVWIVLLFVFILLVETSGTSSGHGGGATELLKARRRHKRDIFDMLNGDFGSFLGKSNQNETAEEKNQRINRSFEKMLKVVSVLGQVDSYLTDRTRWFLQTLNKIVDSKEDTCD